jgi:4'-phosphopantetheinyl transferase
VAVDRGCPRCGEPHGKPRLRGAAAGLEVSVTHSGRRVGLAVATAGVVGLDVEQVEPPRAFPYDAALTAAELAGLRAVPPGQRDRAFVTAWARKEAVLKAAGIGLRLDPRRFAVAPAGRPAALLDWPPDAPPLLPGARLYDLDPGPGYAAALAVLAAADVAVTERPAADLALPVAA